MNRQPTQYQQLLSINPRLSLRDYWDSHSGIEPPYTKAMEALSIDGVVTSLIDFSIRIPVNRVSSEITTKEDSSTVAVVAEPVSEEDGPDWSSLQAELNPSIVIETYPLKNSSIQVVRDDILPGGTKQRALLPYLLRHSANVYVYAGPATGYGGLALAYVVMRMNQMDPTNPRSVVLFLQTNKKKQSRQSSGKVGNVVSNGAHTKLSLKAASYGAEVYLWVDTLKSVQEQATAYVNRRDKDTKFLCPFGFDDPEYGNLLTEALSTAIESTNLEDREGRIRIWSAVGSGLLLRTLASIYVNAELMPVQIGRKMYQDQFKATVWQRMGRQERVNALTAPQKFFEETKIRPPYPSLSNYDGKVWQFVVRHGQAGDIIWNVGSIAK